jgi:hypothetical protein
VDVLPVLPVPVFVDPAALVAEVGVDVAPVPAEGVTPVAVEAAAVAEAPSVAVPLAEELVAAAGVLAA